MAAMKIVTASTQPEFDDGRALQQHRRDAVRVEEEFGDQACRPSPARSIA